MKYAFKMMAVVLALGVFVLGGDTKKALAAKISNCSSCDEQKEKNV